MGNDERVLIVLYFRRGLTFVKPDLAIFTRDAQNTTRDIPLQDINAEMSMLEMNA